MSGENTSILTVHLNDICVHFDAEFVPVAHRAVYPAGTSPLKPGVVVHSPTLTAPGLASSIALNGATITFTPNSGAPFTGFPLPRCVPQLSQWFPWVQPDPNAINGRQLGNDGNLGAYIDFEFGEISMTTDGTSIATRVVMTYPINTPSATIVVTPWPGSSVTPTTIDVTLPATITVSSDASSDSNDDYVLTFQVAASVPEMPIIEPQMEALMLFLEACVEASEDSVGCSNSQFP